MVVDSVPGSPPAADQISSPEQFSALMSMVSAVQPDFGRVVDDIARSGLAALPTADGVGLAVLEDGKLTHLGTPTTSSPSSTTRSTRRCGVPASPPRRSGAPWSRRR